MAKNLAKGCPAKARILSRVTPRVMPRHSPSAVCTLRPLQQRRSRNDRRGACQRSSTGASPAPSCTSTVVTVWSTVLLSTRYSSIHVRYTIAIQTSYTLLWCRVCPRHLIAPGNLQAKYPDALRCILIPGELDWTGLVRTTGQIRDCIDSLK